jgi:hypothetical protein
MKDDVLKKIAHELTAAIRKNITIDWSIRKSAQAGMRRIIKSLECTDSVMCLFCVLLMFFIAITKIYGIIM